MVVAPSGSAPRGAFLAPHGSRTGRERARVRCVRVQTSGMASSIRTRPNAAPPPGRLAWTIGESGFARSLLMVFSPAPCGGSTPPSSNRVSGTPPLRLCPASHRRTLARFRPLRGWSALSALRAVGALERACRRAWREEPRLLTVRSGIRKRPSVRPQRAPPRLGAAAAAKPRRSQAEASSSRAGASVRRKPPRRKRCDPGHGGPASAVRILCTRRRISLE